MNIANLFKIALRAIAANKTRSFLTALGIIIGIASVITMLAIGQGTKRSIQANISEMGSNMIMISPGADMRGGVRQDASSMETLKLADYEAIKEGCTYVKAVSPMVQSAGQFIYGNNNTPSSVYGVNQDYLEIRQLTVSDGEMFTDADIKTSAKVCVLGQTVVDNLFGEGVDPIGKVIRFKSIPFRVVGVLKKKGYNSMGMDQDDLVLAPYTAVMKRILAQTYHRRDQRDIAPQPQAEGGHRRHAGRRRRLQHPLPGRIGKHDELHHQHAHHPAGRGGRHLAHRGWYRHHEHHVCERDGAYP